MPTKSKIVLTKEAANEQRKFFRLCSEYDHMVLTRKRK